ncbi:MAG: hypothetical protein EZS28_002501 [Streblomastix strix]|uniref:Uncharacterized protein n=1 Tax=Streblomastix strix TaxID=222440 RepID=A0A5J4X589_9EUKA|nr:MAG: hypothetical protein EZS28_002501 [Streblomastix strix]
MKNKNNWDSFVLTGCNADPTDRDGVWKMGSTSSQFRIQKQEDEAYDYKGLIIDFDCTSLKFNNQLVSPLPTPPIEQAIKQTLTHGMYESFAWGQFTTYNGRAYISLQVTHSNPNTQSQSTYTLFTVFKDENKPQFTGTPFNISLNAVLFAQKVIGYPICWNGAIPIDCYIDVNAPTAITWHKTRADLNKQLGRQAQKNMRLIVERYLIYLLVSIISVSVPIQYISLIKQLWGKKMKSSSDYELARQTHFRGYYLLNANIINPTSSATGDFAFSAESGTVWMYESAWYDSGQLVPDQVTPASYELPLVDGTASAGISTSYSRGDHVYLQQLTYEGNVTATKFIKKGGTATQILLADGSNKSITDFNTSVVPRAFQIDPADGIYWMCFAVLTIPNFTSNGSCGCTMDINTTYVTDLFYQIKLNLRIQNGYNRRFEAIQLGSVQTDFMICADTPETSLILRFYMKVFTNRGKINGIVQINPTTTNYSQGIRISRNAGGCGIYLGVDPNQTSGQIANQWAIYIPYSDYGQNPLGLTISLTGQENTANRGLRISADGNTLIFNGSVIAGAGATNGASNGSVNYSAGNPILWGVNSVGTEGGFYSDGPKVYWRAKPVTLGAVPP